MNKVWVLLDKKGVVIQVQPHLQAHEADMGFVPAPAEVACGMIKKGNKYVNLNLKTE